MPYSWTLHTLDTPFAAFMEAPNFWTFLTLAWLLALIVGVGHLERKLDRILNHLGLSTEIEKPQTTPLQSRARPRFRTLGMLVRAGIDGAARFVDRLLYPPPPGKGLPPDEV